MNLEITKINVLPINGFRNCVAIVQLELNGCFRLTGIKLFFNSVTSTYYIEYPRNASNKQNRPFFYPTNIEATNAFLNKIVDAYLSKSKVK